MKQCPSCGNTRAWRLADGRLKCQVCTVRYSWTSVWDSTRLSAETKNRLVESFAQGVPVYRLRHHTEACLGSQQRFYRLLRACCTVHEGLREPIGEPVECARQLYDANAPRMRGWATAREVVLIGLRLNADNRVSVFPVPAASAAEKSRLLRQRVALGSVYCVHDRLAFASLKVLNGYVVIGGARDALPALATQNVIESFWRFVSERLQPLRNIPQQFLHLYLGEMCCRFNHREGDFAAVLHQMVHAVSVSDIKSLLVPESGERPAVLPTPAQETLEAPSQDRFRYADRPAEALMIGEALGEVS